MGDEEAEVEGQEEKREAVIELGSAVPAAASHPSAVDAVSAVVPADAPGREASSSMEHHRTLSQMNSDDEECERQCESYVRDSLLREYDSRAGVRLLRSTRIPGTWEELLAVVCFILIEERREDYIPRREETEQAQIRITNLTADIRHRMLDIGYDESIFTRPLIQQIPSCVRTLGMRYHDLQLEWEIRENPGMADYFRHELGIDVMQQFIGTSPSPPPPPPPSAS